MRIGYARVSTHEQNLDMQLDALTKVGCERVYQDRVSGAKEDRPGLEQALHALRPGDTLVVWKLDRLGRSILHLIEVVNSLSDQNVGFHSVTEGIDTSTNGGRFVYNIFASLAEFERGLIRDRTMAGLAAARARGRKGGRPKKLTGRKLAQARAMLKDPDQSVTEVAKVLGVGRATLYRALKAEATNSTA